MTTGIGKSRLMGACIYYLYKTKGYKHFFILAPGNTIYDKMRREAVPGHPKYMFKKEYAIVFTATEQIPSEKLLPVVFEKQKVHTLLQVITYWVNDNEYMIDFVLWQG